MQNIILRTTLKAVFITALCMNVVFGAQPAEQLAAKERTYAFYQFFPKIFQKHLQTLKYVGKTNPKLLVFFSGAPAMGKTTIAKKPEDELGAIRLNVDVVKKLF